MLNTDFKQLVVLDDLRDRLEMINSDILPQSEEHPLVSGIENTPSAILSRDGVSYQAAFTTFPLSPLSKRVNYLKDNFLHFSIDFNFSVVVADDIPQDLNLYVGPRDTASIFNQLQLLIDNNVIWNSTYQQLESAIAMAALPASVVDHNNQYATIDKLLCGKATPMKLIKIPAGKYGTALGTANAQLSSFIIPFTLNYDLTIDLNRLCVPLSSIDYITSNMGNLRLRTYLNNIDQCFYMMQVPAGSLPTAVSGATTVFTSTNSLNSLLSLVPINWGSVTLTSNATPTNQTLLMTNPNVISNNAIYTQTLTVNTNNIDAGDLTITNNSMIPIQFVKNITGQSKNFMQVNVGEICQTCFDLEEDSWIKLCEYFGTLGHVIIPIQLFSTTQFNNGTINPGDSVGSTLLANVPGNNITDIVVTATPTSATSCIINPYLSNIQGLLDGKPLNSVAYEKVNNRAISDFTNACVDTDKDEINTDYLYSLQFPPLINAKSTIDNSGNIVPTLTRDGQSYFYTNDFRYFCGGLDQTQSAPKEPTNTLSLRLNVGTLDYFIKNPNLFMYVWQTGIPESFHTGACIIEQTTRQALFRLQSSGTQAITSSANGSQLQTRFPIYSNTILTGGATASKPTYKINNSASTGLFNVIGMPNTSNTITQFNISALCDACLVLDYDQNMNYCSGGHISYARPYYSDE